MTKCPACNARYRGREKCHRCGMEIAPILAIKERAQSHMKQAKQSFCMELYNKMYHHGRRANALYQTGESIKFLACAALIENKFEEAIKMWRQYQNCQPFSSR
jgi:hypothetical protein